MSRLATAPNWPARAAVALLVATTLLEFLALLPGPGTARLQTMAAVLFAAFIPLALWRARRLNRCLFGLLMAAVVTLIYFDKNVAVPWQAAPQIVLFSAFLSVLQFMRFSVAQSQALRKVRHRLGRLPAKQLASAYTVGSFTIGSFLNVGAHALMAPSLPPDTPPGERRRAALASLLGVAFVSFWSPFFVALAFVTHQIPAAPTGRVIIVGLSLGVLGVVAVLALNAGFRGIDRTLWSLTPLAPGAAVSATVLIGVSWWAGYSAVQAIVLCVPIMALIYFVAQRGTGALAIVTEGCRSVANANDEILIISAALVLAACIKDLPGAIPGLMHGLAGLPPIALLAVAIGLMIVAGMLGVHPTISSTLLITALSRFPTPLSPTVLAEALLVGWSLAATVSPVGLTVMIAGQVYQIPHLRLIYSRNLIYVPLIAAGSAVALTLLNNLTSSQF